MKLFCVLVLSFLSSVVLYGQSTYTTGFEPPDFVLGDVNGQDGWGHLDNSPTGGTIVPVPADSPAMFGTQSLALYTRNAVNLSVANRLFSATIDPPAGETGSTVGGVVVPDPETHFSASVWVHLPETPVVSTRMDRRIAELDPSSKGSGPDAVANRYAVVRVYNDPNGFARVELVTFGAVANVNAIVANDLQWGEWYRFDYLIELVDGLDGAEPNDRFTLTIYDEAGARVGSACGSTWEVGWKDASFGFGGGTTPRAINGFDFWSTTGPDGTVVAHLDNLTMSAFTPAGGALAVAIDGATNVCAGGTTPLSADVTGGSGTIASYSWVDANSNVVGTAPTLVAGPGTYTLTVSDALCVNASSSPFTITAYAPLGVTISGTELLTANVTGGSGTISSYTWRNAEDDVVASGPTFDAPAGTYTVTVVDASCGTATSAAATVAAEAVTNIPAMGEWGLAALAMLLVGAAMMRMR